MNSFFFNFMPHIKRLHFNWETIKVKLFDMIIFDKDIKIITLNKKKKSLRLGARVRGSRKAEAKKKLRSSTKVLHCLPSANIHKMLQASAASSFMTKKKLLSVINGDDV